MKGKKPIVLLNVLLSLALFLYLTAIVLPKSVFQTLKGPLHLTLTSLLWASVLLLCVKLVVVLRRSQGRPPLFIELFPFLMVFLLCAYRYAATMEYHWGVDDTCYYAYMPSLLLDHDLDFMNQYKTAHLEEQLPGEFFLAKTRTGHVENIFPVGSSICWAPFFLIGHCFAWLLYLFHQGLPLDGYSRPYWEMVALGNLAYLLAGVFLCYRFLSTFFSKTFSYIVSVGMLFALAPLYYFTLDFAFVSEPLSMFFVALVFFLSLQLRAGSGLMRMLLLGAVCGLMVIVRLQNFIYCLIPFLLMAVAFHPEIRAQWRSLAKAWCCLALGMALGFLPQLVIWKALYGSWYVNFPGRFLLWWKSPFILETLFSARNGFFPWCPIAVFSVIGLFFFLRKSKIWGLVVIVLFGLTVYFNASQEDWWGSASTGPRRFISAYPILAAGLAALFSFLSIRWRKTAYLSLTALLVFFSGMNVYLVGAIRESRMSNDHANRYSDVLRGYFSIYNAVVYPLEFPVQVYYHWRYGLDLYGAENEWFIGEDILYFQQKHGSLVEGDSPIFAEGWQERKTDDNKTVRVTTRADCFLRLPMFFKGAQRLVLKAHLGPEEGGNGCAMKVLLNGHELAKRQIPPRGATISVRILPKDMIPGINQMQFQFPANGDPPCTGSMVLDELSFQKLTHAVSSEPAS